MNEAEISALIDLLDDPDASIYSSVRTRFLDLGEQVIPNLELAWEASFNNLVQDRIEEIIHNIQYARTLNNLTAWVERLDPDLLEGALIIAKYQYPDLDEDRVRNKIEVIKRDIWLELNNNLTALEKVRIMNHIIFEIHGYSGNTQNYHAPQNSYINNVVESKKGNPLLLSIVYSFIAQSLNLPIYGVNLPDHFVLCYKDLNEEGDYLITRDNAFGVLFYINAFSKGTVFGKRDIDIFLRQLNLEPKELYYTPCSNRAMIARMLNNLIAAYQRSGNPEKLADLRTMLAIVNQAEENNPS